MPSSFTAKISALPRASEILENLAARKGRLEADVAFRAAVLMASTTILDLQLQANNLSPDEWSEFLEAVTDQFTRELIAIFKLCRLEIEDARALTMAVARDVQEMRS